MIRYGLLFGIFCILLSLMKPLSLKKRRFYFYTLLAIFFIIIPIITLYTSGYRIGKGFHLVETGGIYIYSPEAGADIYVDNKKKKTTNIFQKELFLQDLKPGTYVVYITKDGFWPWAKEVEVEERKVTTTIAFLVPKEPKGEVIPRILVSDPALSTTTPTTGGKLNPEYMDVVTLFQKHEAEKRRIFALAEKVALATSSPENTQEIFLATRGRVGLWQDDTRVIATWQKDEKSLPNYFCRDKICENTVIVFNSVAPIKDIDFYPGREDVVLIAVQNGIYVIEIDARKYQNFQPVYKGVDPYFVLSGNTLYIKDNDNFFKINL